MWVNKGGSDTWKWQRTVYPMSFMMTVRQKPRLQTVRQKSSEPGRLRRTGLRLYLLQFRDGLDASPS